MEYIKTYEQFITESKSELTGPAELSPERKAALAIITAQEKIKALKQEMVEKPEMKEFTAAKLRVEMEKLDVLLANKALASAKKREAFRKEKEKRMK